MAILVQSECIFPVNERTLFDVLLQEGFIIGCGFYIQCLESTVCPSAPYEGLLQNTEIFAGSSVVAFYQIDFGKSLHHSDIPVVRRADVGEHRSTFAESHVAQNPIQFVQGLDGKGWGAWSQFLECTQVVALESQ